MSDQLNVLQSEALAGLEAASDAAALEAWRVRYLGRKGALADAMQTLGSLPREERPAYGQAANAVKTALEAAYSEHEQALQAQALDAELTSGAVDISLPGREPAVGLLHITTQTLREMCTIFAQMGFQVYDAPDVETEENNFTLLNIPPYHPARDMWDTFWVSQDASPDAAQKSLVLRTHTSPGQIRAMREYCPEPIRVILPGKCYRYEQVSARSEHQFYQIEGLVVGKNIRMTDLIGTLQQFARQMYGPGRRLRVRGVIFPSPSRALRPIWTASCAAARVAPYANTPVGWRSPAPAWCIRSCWPTADTTPRSTPVSRSDPASSDLPCSST
jgi:phenylalanyl-tRNA synthetase alpha chain